MTGSTGDCHCFGECKASTEALKNTWSWVWKENLAGVLASVPLTGLDVCLPAKRVEKAHQRPIFFAQTIARRSCPQTGRNTCGFCFTCTFTIHIVPRQPLRSLAFRLAGLLLQEEACPPQRHGHHWHDGGVHAEIRTLVGIWVRSGFFLTSKLHPSEAPW